MANTATTKTSTSSPWTSIRPTDETLIDPHRASAADQPAPQWQLPEISIDFGDNVGGDKVWSGATGLEVTGTLGEGGMGVVLLARQHLLGREVAIKTIKQDGSRVAHAALLAEAQISGSLEHPGIIPVHALGVDPTGRPLLVMKRVHGVVWRDLMADHSHAAWQHWTGNSEDRLVANLEILIQVCNAVHFAHSHGVIHRDIKPHNVLIGRYGDVYLADWGLATRLADRRGKEPFSGTPVYAAPEMVSGIDIGIDSDVYLLGATLHHILVGEPRHRATTVSGALNQALLSEPHDYPTDIPYELATLANAATARDRSKRPPDADAFRRHLADFLQHRSSRQLTASAVERIAALSELLDREDDSDGQSGRPIDEMIAEARFGLKQALAEWPGNRAAQTAQIDLDVLLQKRTRRREALGRLARDLDPRRASRQRSSLFMVFAAIVIGQSTMGIMQWSSGTLWTAQQLTFHTLAGLAIIVGTVIALRGPLRRSAINRRAALLAVTSLTALAAGRAFAWFSGEAPANILAHDLLLLGAIAALASAMISRWFVALIATMPVSALVCRLWPQHAVLVFSFATALSSVVVMLAMRGEAVDPAFERSIGPANHDDNSD